MLTTKSLDQRIREQAVNEMKERVDATMKPIQKMMQIGYGLKVQLGAVTHNAHDLLQEIRQALIAELTPQAGEDAVKAFIDKVTNLQGQIEDLRESVEE